MQLKGCWQTGLGVIQTTLSIVIAVLFVLAASGFVAGVSITRAVVAPANARQVVQQPGVVEQGRALFASLFIHQVEDQYQSIPLLSQVPSSTIQAAIADLFSDDWVKTALANTISGFQSWLDDGPQFLPQVTYNLMPIKAYLRTSQGAQNIQQLVQSIPACSDSFSLLDLLNLGNLNCIPRGVSLTLFTPILAASISNLIPDQITLDMIYQGGSFTSADSAHLREVKAGYQFIQTWTGIGLWMAIILLLIYVLLQLSSMRRVLASVPWIFDGAGIFSLLLVAGIGLVLKPFTSWLSSYVLSGLGTGFQNFLPEIVGTIWQQARIVWALGAVGLLVAGILFHLINLIYKAMRRRYLELPG